jgi:hypothetical protein
MHGCGVGSCAVKLASFWAAPHHAAVLVAQLQCPLSLRQAAHLADAELNSLLTASTDAFSWQLVQAR